MQPDSRALNMLLGIMGESSCLMISKSSRWYPKIYRLRGIATLVGWQSYVLVHLKKPSNLDDGAWALVVLWSVRMEQGQFLNSWGLYHQPLILKASGLPLEPTVLLQYTLCQTELESKPAQISCCWRRRNLMNLCSHFFIQRPHSLPSFIYITHIALVPLHYVCTCSHARHGVHPAFLNMPSQWEWANKCPPLHLPTGSTHTHTRATRLDFLH